MRKPPFPGVPPAVGKGQIRVSAPLSAPARTHTGATEGSCKPWANMRITVGGNAGPGDLISGHARSMSRPAGHHQAKVDPFDVLATVRPSRTYRNDITTVYFLPFAGLAPAGPHPCVAASPPNVRVPHGFGPAPVRPLLASCNATVMLPVPPPGAVSDAWYWMSRPSI